MSVWVIIGEIFIWKVNLSSAEIFGYGSTYPVLPLRLFQLSLNTTSLALFFGKSEAST